MNKKNVNKKEKKFVKQQNMGCNMGKQKQRIYFILEEIEDPNIVKKIFTYVWTITR